MDRADYAHWNSADVARLLALLESERRYYQEIVARIPVGLLVVTSDLRVASANAAVRRIFNLRSADPVRGSLDLLLPHGILDAVVNALRSNRPQFGLMVNTRPELGSRQVRVSIRPMTGWDIDNPREALITVEDLTGAHFGSAAEEPASAAEAQAAAEEMAAEMAEAAAEAMEAASAEETSEPIAVIEITDTAAGAEDRLTLGTERALINQLDAAIWACELPEMRFIFVSDGALRMFGFPAEQWMETPNFWSERIDPADRERLLARYMEAVAGDQHYSLELRARTADGRSVWTHESARLVDGGEGSRYMVGFTVDISDRMEAETSKITRQRLDALKALSARLSHDLNNLLMIVTGYTEDALAGVSQGTAAHSGLTAIRTAGERLAAIASQLRIFATYAPSMPAATDVNRVLSRVADSVNGHRVKVEPAAAPVWVRADETELEEAIRGAVTRAVSAMPDGGDVTVTAYQSDDLATIEIRDTAPPMSTDEHSGFFEQLLGGRYPSEESISALARAWFAVEHWGGRISVERTERGNVVRIMLPVTEAPGEPAAREPVEEAAAPAAEAPAEEAAAAPPEAPAVQEEEPAVQETPATEETPAPAAPAPGPKSILVVEDEAGIRALVRKILERHGYSVLDAPKAEDAISVLENNPVDLIITDVVMPDMSGQQLAEHLRRLRPEIRVLFISGYTDDTSMYTREFGPGTAFLQKPFTLGALVGKVREVLGGE